MSEEYKFEILNLEVTNICNFNCKFCPKEIMRRKKGFMRVELAKKVLKEVNDLKLAKKVFFHVMGEPLLHPNIDKIVEYAKKLGFETELFTNGWFLSEKESTIRNLDRIELSFQLLNKREFSILRPGVNFNEYLKRIKEGLSICSKYDVLVDFAVMVNPFQQLLDFNRIFEVIPSKRKIEEIKKYLLRLFNEPNLNYRIVFKILEPWGEATFSSNRIYKALFGACLGFQSHFAVLWDGTVVLCCKDYDGLNKIGNVNFRSLKEIIYSGAAKRIRRLLKLNVIPPLPYCKICKGGCTLKSWFFNQFGSIFFNRVLIPVFSKKKDSVTFY